MKAAADSSKRAVWLAIESFKQEAINANQNMRKDLLRRCLTSYHSSQPCATEGAVLWSNNPFNEVYMWQIGLMQTSQTSDSPCSVQFASHIWDLSEGMDLQFLLGLQRRRAYIKLIADLLMVLYFFWLGGSHWSGPFQRPFQRPFFLLGHFSFEERL